MKLKYYFRGIGIGVVVTTLVFMILISIHKNDGIQGTDAAVQDTESRTIAQLEADTQKPSAKTKEQKESGEEKTPNEKEEPENKAEPQDQKTPAGSTEGEKTDADKPAEPPENKTEPAAPEFELGSVPESAPVKEEKVRIEISGGQYSDVVCRKLEEAGLVDSAKAFNDFLVEKDYDNAILPGVYEIPKGATYEEIAVLLTTKV